MRLLAHLHENKRCLVLVRTGISWVLPMRCISARSASVPLFSLASSLMLTETSRTSADLLWSLVDMLAVFSSLSVTFRARMQFDRVDQISMKNEGQESKVEGEMSMIINLQRTR